ncbi:MAG: hypothetical protein R3F49_11790 [Planctomycetota bacterium]
MMVRCATRSIGRWSPSGSVSQALLWCAAHALVGSAAAAQAPALEAWSLPPRGGRLEVVAGTRVLHVRGDEVERGFAEGYLCADELIECFNEFALGHVVAGRPELWDLLVLPAVRSQFEFPSATRSWSRAVAAGVRIARLERGLGPALAPLGRELTGADVLACAAIPDLAGLLCSSFAAWGEATASGDVFVGRNLDYPSTPAIERNAFVRVSAPEGGRAGWIGVGWPGSPGCLTGLSERGVFVAIHDVVAGPRQGRGKCLPRVLALEELVESLTPSAAIGALAVSALRRHSFAMGGNVMLAYQLPSDAARGAEGTDADADPGARGALVLELDGRGGLDGGVTARSPGLGEPFVACSNHHRLRAADGHACPRYGALLAGARAAVAPSGPGRLDLAGAWALIRQSEMGITLYRCVADLGGRAIEVERKTQEGWQPSVALRYHDGEVVVSAR